MRRIYDKVNISIIPPQIDEVRLTHFNDQTAQICVASLWGWLLLVVIDKNAKEKIRILSQKAAERVKVDGLDNDLVECVKIGPYFSPIVNKLDVLLDAKTFIERAPKQVYEFISR